MMNNTATISATIASSPTNARRGLGSGGPLSLTGCPSVIERHGRLGIGPLIDQRIADPQQHRTKEDAE